MLARLAAVAIVEQPASATFTRRRWTRDEYYRTATIRLPGESVRPLLRPDAEVAVDALLPRVG